MFTYTYEYVSPKLVIESAVDSIRRTLAKKQSLRKFKSDLSFAREVKGKFFTDICTCFLCQKEQCNLCQIFQSVCRAS